MTLHKGAGMSEIDKVIYLFDVYAIGGSLKAAAAELGHPLEKIRRVGVGLQRGVCLAIVDERQAQGGERGGTLFPPFFKFAGCQRFHLAQPAGGVHPL